MATEVIIEKGKDGLFSAFVNDDSWTIPLNGQGYSSKDAIADMFESLEELKEYYKEEWSEIPEELINPTFKYKYDIQSLFDNFSEINISSFARRFGFNHTLLLKYKKGLAFASEKQCKKIQAGINQLGRELAGVEL